MLETVLNSRSCEYSNISGHNYRDVNKAGSFKAKAKSLKAKSLKAKARSLKAKTRDQG